GQKTEDGRRKTKTENRSPSVLRRLSSVLWPSLVQQRDRLPVGPRRDRLQVGIHVLQVGFGQDRLLVGRHLPVGGAHEGGERLGRHRIGRELGPRHRRALPGFAVALEAAVFLREQDFPARRVGGNRGAGAGKEA